MYFLKQITHSEEDTTNLAKDFAKRLVPGDIIALIGNLGSGKTVFVRGICEFFSVDDFVTSPTFTIMNQYFGKLKGMEIPIFHIDLFRIKKPEEFAEIGFNECLEDTSSIKLIEWAEKAISQIHFPFYKVLFENGELDDDRIITITILDKY